MPSTVWIGAALIACALPLIYWSLNQGHAVSAQAVRNLGQNRPSTLRAAQLEVPALERLGLPIISGLGRAARNLTPTEWLRRYEKNLARAGKLGRWSAEQVVGAKLGTAIIAIIYGGVRILGDPSAKGVLVVGGITVFFFFVPDLLLRSMADRRQEKILDDLPDVLDQLTMSVEAGLGFESAIAKISERETHPLAQELGRMIQDIRLGKPRSDAMAELATRVDVQDLRTVILSLRQSEKLGVPLAKTLRIQADEMRTKRKFRAEEKAHKLPIKMIFPLGMCILPALFIVILGPAAIQISEVF